MADLSQSVKSVLDALVARGPEYEFSAEDAKSIFNGSKAVKVKDLSERQLLQFALICALADKETLIAELDASRETKVISLNREQRRAITNGKH